MPNYVVNCLYWILLFFFQNVCLLLKIMNQHNSITLYLSSIILYLFCCLPAILAANPIVNSVSPIPLRPECVKSVSSCVPLENQECFGAPVQYQFTAPGLFSGDVTTLELAREQLQLWSALRNVPQCWEVVQPLLCAIYLPRCSNISSNVSVAQLPSRELCDVVQMPCRVVEQYGGWPEYLKCEQTHFKKSCAVSTVCRLKLYLVADIIIISTVRCDISKGH